MGVIYKEGNLVFGLFRLWRCSEAGRPAFRGRQPLGSTKALDLWPVPESTPPLSCKCIAPAADLLRALSLEAASAHPASSGALWPLPAPRLSKRVLGGAASCHLPHLSPPMLLCRASPPKKKARATVACRPLSPPSSDRQIRYDRKPPSTPPCL